MIAKGILDGAKAMEIPLTEKAAQAMEEYWEKLLVRNETLNLTRLTSDEDAINLHFLDSLAPLAYEGMIPQNASVCDVGTGAGFPGVPLAIAREDITMTLVDARRKRLDFIQESATVPLECIHTRAEDLNRKFDVVTARAVAATPALCRLLFPLLKKGGRMILWKGPAVLEEMTQVSQEISSLGGQLFEPTFYEIGNIQAQHCLLFVDRP